MGDKNASTEQVTSRRRKWCGVGTMIVAAVRWVLLLELISSLFDQDDVGGSWLGCLSRDLFDFTKRFYRIEMNWQKDGSIFTQVQVDRQDFDLAVYKTSYFELSLAFSRFSRTPDFLWWTKHQVWAAQHKWSLSSRERFSNRSITMAHMIASNSLPKN